MDDTLQPVEQPTEPDAQEAPIDDQDDDTIDDQDDDQVPEVPAVDPPVPQSDEADLLEVQAPEAPIEAPPRDTPPPSRGLSIDELG